MATAAYPLESSSLAPALGSAHGAASGTGTPSLAEQATAFPHASAAVVRFQGAETHPETCGVICESSLAVEVGGEPLVSLLCSRANLRELAYGFLYSEGVVARLGDVRAYSFNETRSAACFTLAEQPERPACPVVSSGFGGRTLNGLDCPGANGNLEAYDVPAVRPADVARIQVAMRTMSAHAVEYARTRGLHCSALFREGELVACYEDIGRHNTFDKLAGQCLLEGIDCSGMLLATTGRVSAEMARKALRLGVAGIASFSGPTDRAVALARAAGVLLAGYVGSSSAVVYAAPTRAVRHDGLSLVP